MWYPNRQMICGQALFAVLLSLSYAESRIIPPRVIDEPNWNFPLAAERAGIRHGEVRAILNISEEGRLLDFLVVGWTHRVFGEEMTKAINYYRFSPARVQREPTPVRLAVTFYFQQQGSVISMTPLEKLDQQMSIMTERTDYTVSICPPERLDRPLTVAHAISPAYPNEMRGRGEPGKVTIDFYVDGEGRVRMPAADAGTHPSFARAAAAALEQWRFEPPTCDGQPVIVHVEQTFHFAAPTGT